MKTKKKSNTINYEQIYRTCAIASICFLSYIIISFFLSVSNFICVFLLFSSIIFLLMHLFFKINFYLVTSFVCCILCILANIFFIYIAK